MLFLPGFGCGFIKAPISDSTLALDTPGGNSLTTSCQAPRAISSNSQRARTRKLPRPLA